MPKKFAEDTRGAKAKEQKSKAAADRSAADEAARKAAEDEEWAAGANALALKKKQEEEMKRAEAEARRAAAAAQLAAEEEALGRGGKGLRGADRVAAARAVAVDKLSRSLESASVTESVDARSVDAAISALSGATGAGGAGAVERHPERRLRSAYAAFEERELPILKEENPGLRLSQLKNMLQKMWKKSPDNPMNQEHVAYNATVGDGPE